MAGAYYNEIDPYCAQWLRNLITAGHIAPGEVDERSITEVQPNDLSGFTQCHFFAGIGIWSLAARLAGWPDERPLWTGSCPCQPFSVAGKQKGFADERHLWPVWRNLIAVRHPPVIAGEQVAAASDWLGIVRSDLEALGYAVGAEPIQAASAGADHLRDRYWFVADDGFGRRAGPGWRQGEQSRGAEAVGAGGPGVAQGDACSPGLAVGSIAEIKRRDLRREGAPSAAASSGSQSMAHADQPCTSEGREQRSGEQCRIGGDQAACAGRDVADCEGIGSHGRPGSEAQGHGETEQRSGDHDFDWVIGADGKARRVKPGIRLLVNGHPNRVAKLRAFGNAIDPRPAAQWIGAYLDCGRLAP